VCGVRGRRGAGAANAAFLAAHDPCDAAFMCPSKPTAAKRCQCHRETLRTAVGAVQMQRDMSAAPALPEGTPPTSAAIMCTDTRTTSAKRAAPSSIDELRSALALAQGQRPLPPSSQSPAICGGANAQQQQQQQQQQQRQQQQRQQRCLEDTAAVPAVPAAAAATAHKIATRPIVCAHTLAGPVPRGFLSPLRSDQENANSDGGCIVAASASAAPLPACVTAAVQGDYEFFHYGHQGVDDSGWGCAYRAAQMLCSWQGGTLLSRFHIMFRLSCICGCDAIAAMRSCLLVEVVTGSEAGLVPSLRELQAQLVSMGLLPSPSETAGTPTEIVRPSRM
jgi:hypothetical protein